jgi:hyperosmotically inducible protein
MTTSKKVIASLCALTFAGFISTAVFAENTDTHKTAATTTTTEHSDAAITAAVKAKLATPPAISGDVTATTKDGVVELTGAVKSDADVSIAVEKAESTMGVKDVDSKLTVEGSNQPLTDTVTTAKIKGVFIREKLFGDKDLTVMKTHVDTDNGVVTLTCNAETQMQITNATKLAKEVSGVKEVKNKMQLVPEHATENKEHNTNMHNNKKQNEKTNSKY